MKPFLFFCLFVSTSAFAVPLSISERPRIEVQGVAEIKAAPDRAVVSFSIIHFDKNRKRALKQFRDDWTKSQKVLKSFSSSTKTPKSEQLHVVSTTRSVPGRSNAYVYGTEVKRSQSVVITDIAKVEKIVRELLEGGVTSISELRFESSKMNGLKEGARVQAVIAAKKKASQMCKAIGQSCTKAILIRESGGRQVRGSGSTYSNFSMESVDAGLPSVGLVRTTLTVSLTFELDAN